MTYDFYSKLPLCLNAVEILFLKSIIKKKNYQKNTQERENSSAKKSDKTE